jgi:hypothetical protein
MIATGPGTWNELNHRYLNAALDDLRRRIDLEYPADRQADSLPEVMLEQMPIPPAIESLRELFGLSRFERDLLLLCAGVELDYQFARVIARVSGRETVTAPTFSLAMAVLDAPHWSAVTPAGPLRQWRLIEMADSPTLTSAPLRIAERVLHYLTGCLYLDEQLSGLVESLEPGETLVDPHAVVSAMVARAWIETATDERPPVIQIVSPDHDSALGIAINAITRLGMQAALTRAESIPADIRQREELARLWERESVLGSRVLVLDCTGNEDSSPATEQPSARFIERIASPVVTLSRRPLALGRTAVRFDVAGLGKAGRESVWREALAQFPFDLNGTASALAEQFHLDAAVIRDIARDVSMRVGTDDPYRMPILIRDLCRERTRPRLDRLAQRIDPAAGWDDLVLPAPQRGILRDIAMHVRHRQRVYGDWGFSARGLRGLGISALFSGPSGTGKTMAAEVLASELDLDLYRIDLSRVVSKYIGETEKNLAGLFDAAEGNGVILLFDEADALFGKRSEVRDSHDRYANIEVSYLLQRMETYSGLAILTTNLKSALDQAFLRRIRFVMQFPFPDAPARAEIWRRVFPSETPLSRVDVEKLSRLGLAGGNIRNIALNAAFLAVEAEEPVGMHHLLHATRSEATKLERPLADSEIRGWVE